MKEYKVLKRKLKSIIDTDELEETLNKFAQKGWRVVSSNSVFFGSAAAHSLYSVILERDVQ